ncbi:MAG: 4Fe-4S dicluster domain-containing protein [Syntrophobacteraceae bacterium]|nr:4Fe-4S dicluster domain-containing protein [Syntrophobacteraceae bacterium]
MASGKSIMVDTSKCTGCRGCQVACKQWNGLPGTKTKQIGTYQNPQDFSADTYKVVRFADGKLENGKPYWYFFSDMCRHCLDPACLDAIQGYVDGGAVKDEATGAVIYTEKSKEAPFEEVRNSCPFDIPRQNEKTKVLAKCTMCIDRITNDRPPACVKSCPTGAVIFGERAEILELVKKRVEELKKTYPKAEALKADEVRVIYVVTDDPQKYHKHAAG